MRELVFDDIGFNFRTYPYFETSTASHVAFSEHILVLRQLLEFISMSIFKHLRNYETKQDFFDKVKQKQN